MARRKIHAAVLTLTALSFAPPAMLAQEAGEVPAETFSGGTVLVIDHADLTQFFPDERDQGLLRALEMIPARVGELPREIEESDFTAETAAIINSVLHALARPGRMAVMYDETPTGGFFGYGLLLSVETAGQEEARALQSRVRSMLREANPNLQIRASQRFKGMSDIQLPVGVLSLGPRHTPRGWRYELILGTMPNPDAGGEVIPPPPEGLTPLVQAYFNARGLMPALDMAGAMAGGREIPPQLAGPSEVIRRGLVTTYVAGFTRDAMVSRMVVHGARGAADQLMVGTQPLAADDFRVIPADATNAYMRRLHQGWATKLVQSLAAVDVEVEQGIQQFEGVTGFNIYDFAAAIGDRVCVYTSEMTGGGGFGSLVGLVSIADREKLQESLSHLVEFANEQGRTEARGYVQIVQWEDGGTTMYSLRFPGVPIPMELTLGITEQWLIMAPLPQSVVAASRQIAGGSAGLVPSARTAGFVAADKPMVEFGFMDTGHALAAGYPWLSLLGSGVANMVRSPSDPMREPGMVIPLYGELVSGVRPAVKTTVWDGDALVSESTASRSTVVNVGATLGTLSKFVPLIAAGAAAAAEQNRFGARDTDISPLRGLAVLAMPLPERLALRMAAGALPPGRIPTYVEAVLTAPSPDRAR